MTPSSKYTNNYLVDAISDQSEYSLSEDDETYSKDVTKNNLNTIRNPSAKSTESSFSCTSSSSTESHKNIIGGIKSKNRLSRDLSKVPEKQTKQKPLLADINKDVDLFDSDSDDDLFQTKKKATRFRRSPNGPGGKTQRSITEATGVAPLAALTRPTAVRHASPRPPGPR